MDCSSVLLCVCVCVCVGVLPEVDGADVSLDASSGAQHLAAVLPQALEHHLHGVLQERKCSSFSQKHCNGFKLRHAWLFFYFWLMLSCNHTANNIYNQVNLSRIKT